MAPDRVHGAPAASRSRVAGCHARSTSRRQQSGRTNDRVTGRRTRSAPSRGAPTSCRIAMSKSYARFNGVGCWPEAIGILGSFSPTRSWPAPRMLQSRIVRRADEQKRGLESRIASWLRRDALSGGTTPLLVRSLSTAVVERAAPPRTAWSTAAGVESGRARGSRPANPEALLGSLVGRCQLRPAACVATVRTLAVLTGGVSIGWSPLGSVLTSSVRRPQCHSPSVPQWKRR